MQKYIKRFTKWILIKIERDNFSYAPPHFNEREIWWCYVGENIGIEICGKGEEFKRPVLIIRKLDRYSFIGIPLTRTIRFGSWYESITVNNISNSVILSQIRHFDYRRMHSKILTLPNEDFLRIKKRLHQLIK